MAREKKIKRNFQWSQFKKKIRKKIHISSWELKKRRGVVDVTSKEMSGPVRTLGQEGVFVVPAKDGRQCRQVTSNTGPVDNPESLTEQIKDATRILSALVKLVCEND